MSILRPLKLLLLAGAGYIAYKIVENARVDANETRMDGWQQTAANMRPTPKSILELESESYPRAPIPRS